MFDFDLIGEPAASKLRRLVDQQRRDRKFAASAADAGQPSVRWISEKSCYSTTLSTADFGGGSQPSESFGDLLRNSLAIFSGRIIAIEPGFMAGVPASLLQVEVGEVPRPSREYPQAGHLYVLYPSARFALRNYTFCGGGSNSFDPRPGDRILVFAYTAPVARDAAVAAPRREQMFFESSTGALFVPPALREDPALQGVRSLDEVAQRARQWKKESPNRPEGAPQ